MVDIDYRDGDKVRSALMRTYSAIPRHTAESWRDRLPLGAYRQVEAAGLVGTTRQAIARWLRLIPAPERVVRSDASPRPFLLSYPQLIEVALVATFSAANVSLPDLGRAHAHLRAYYQVDHPFARVWLGSDEARIFTALYRQAPTLQRAVAEEGGRPMWIAAVRERLAQFDYDEEIVVRWYVRGRQRTSAVDPRLAFGTPVIVPAGVPTRALAERAEAGESPEDLAADFGLSLSQIDDALAFEGSRVTPAA